MATHIETERKYALDEVTAVPDVRGGQVRETGEPRTLRLRAVYYDTERLDLAAHGITLRRREGGEDAGWHLKLPTDLRDTRVELAKTLGRSERPPRDFVAAVTAFTHGRSLRKTAELRTTRTVVDLRDGDGGVLAELADDRVEAELLAEPGTMAWRELEVELVDGSPKVLGQVDKVLHAAGIELSDSSSKLRRVVGEPPVPSRVSGLKQKSAGAALHTYLDKRASQLRAADLAHRTTDAGVHEIRKSARRLRSALTVYAPLLDDERATTLAEELRWLGRTLSASRDLEVAGDRLVTALEDDDASAKAVRAARRTLGVSQREAAREAREALRSPRYVALLVALDELLTAPVWSDAAARPATAGLPKLLVKDLKRTRKRVRRTRAAGPFDLELLHPARKAAKRSRYALEVAEPALGKPAKRIGNELATIQTVLGDQLDSVELMDWWQELGQVGADDFAFGRMHLLQERLVLAHFGEYPAAAAPLLAGKWGKGIAH